MPYQAYSAQGSKLQFGSPLATVHGVNGIKGPGRTASDIIVTAIDDLNEVKVPGVGKIAPVTFTLFWDPADAQHVALEAANKAHTQQSFGITFSDAGAATLAFTAFVSGWEHDATQDSGLAVSVTLTLYQDWTLTP